MLGMMVAAAALSAAMATPTSPAPVQPTPPRVAPDDPCTLPVSGPVPGLAACPEPRREPFVSCVVPVGRTPGVVVPDPCLTERPAPEGLVVPLAGDRRR